jgi:hypothetical protein
MHAVLSFDPGQTHLGMALLLYDQKDDLTNACNYHVVSWEIWNLNVDGPSLAANLSTLHGLLSGQSASVAHVLAEVPRDRIEVYVEASEGYGRQDRANFGLINKLTRLNAITGALWMYFADKAAHVALCGKQSKWGFMSLGAPGDRCRRKRLIVRYVQLLLDYGPKNTTLRGSLARIASPLREHPCDCILQGMAATRALYHRPRAYRNIISPHLLELVEAVRVAEIRRLTEALSTRDIVQELSSF